MNGPEHYRLAENLLAQADDEVSLGQSGKERATQYAAVAQVHATLALAASTIEARLTDREGEAGGAEAWGEVLTTQPEVPEKRKAQRGVIA